MRSFSPFLFAAFSSASLPVKLHTLLASLLYSLPTTTISFKKMLHLSEFQNAAFMPFDEPPYLGELDGIEDLNAGYPMEDLAFLCAGRIPASPVAVFAVILNQAQLQRRHLHDCDVIATNRRGSTSLGFPGGKQDPGETQLECLRREIFEECGLLLDLTAFTTIRVHHKLVANHHCITYLIVMDDALFSELPPTFCGQEPGIAAQVLPLHRFLEQTEFRDHNKGVISALTTLVPLLLAPRDTPELAVA